MTMLNCLVTLCAPEVTVTFTAEVPATVGVPEILEAELSTVKPAGSPVADHEYDQLPPLAERTELYEIPTVPLERELVTMAVFAVLEAGAHEGV
jgi:hypothetical protein